MSDLFNKNVGAILKLYRCQNDLTLEEASKAMSKSKSWLGDIESGRNRIYFEDIKKICNVYNVQLSDVINELNKYE